LVRALEEYAKKHNIPIMEKEGIDFLKDFIIKNNIKTILEIGSAIGYSAISFALINKDIKVVTIEKDIDRYNEAVKNINNFNLNNQIKIINKDALEIEVDGKFDLIFIDAAKSQSIKFFNKYKHNLNKDGFIITDNIHFHGLVTDETKIKSRNMKQLVRKIKEYINFLDNNKDYKTTYVKVGDTISITKQVN
jgi:predicted O-methyltransferase YrrM